MSAEATGWTWRTSPWRGSSPAKFLLHLAVADVANDAHDHRFWMTQSALAAKAGVARKTANQWLAEAVDAGVLELVEPAAGGGPNTYRLVPPSQAPPVTSGDTPCNPRLHPPVTSGDIELKGTKTNTKDAATAASERVVFDAWVAATGRSPGRVKLNAARRRAIRARLAEGYTEEDLVGAVVGLSRSSWHAGENPQRKRYDDLTVALRDGERVERFRDLEPDAGAATASAVDEALRRAGGGS